MVTGTDMYVWIIRRLAPKGSAMISVKVIPQKAFRILYRVYRLMNQKSVDGVNSCANSDAF